jgi:hypothetical protein
MIPTMVVRRTRSEEDMGPALRLLNVALVFLFCIFCSISASAQNVIVVVMDGARYTETFGAGSTYVPHLWNDLKPQGTLYTSFRIGSPGKTETVPGHATAVTGTWQLVSNDINGVPTRPTVFEYFRKEDGHAQSECYLVAGKSKLAAVAYSSDAEYGANYRASVSAGDRTDDQVYSNLVSVMDTYHPKLIVVNFPSVDGAGHSGNWANYLAAVTHADLLIHQLWQKIQSDSYYGPGNTTLFVTNDHGRHDDAHGGFQNHGDDCEGCRRIMLLAVGRGVTPNQVIADTRYQIDIAPTIADLLDFTAVYAVGTSLLDATPPPPPFDFTGDLKSDVLWRHATRGDVWLWPMDGATRLSETYVRTVPDTGWQIRGLGDQTGDGIADILWRHAPTGMIYVWPMSGGTPLSDTYVATVDPAYDVVGTGDYNGDDKSDILWRHVTTGAVWIWLMNGATPLSQVYVDTVDPAYWVVGSGDLNGDTKADIVWRHATTGEVWIWLMNGTTRLSQTWIGAVPDVGYQIVGVADHTGDGTADIVWHHATRGEVWIWPMDGTTVLSQSYVDTVPDTGYQIVGSGDYNGDGKADILWHHATRGEVWVWPMDGTTRLSQTWVASVPEVGYQITKVR